MLDDMGTENITDWTRSVLYELLDKRMRNEQQFIITTNLSLKDIAERIDPRLSSRFSEYCEVITVEGNDRRLS